MNILIEASNEVAIFSGTFQEIIECLSQKLEELPEEIELDLINILGFSDAKLSQRRDQYLNWALKIDELRAKAETMENSPIRVKMIG